MRALLAKRILIVGSVILLMGGAFVFYKLATNSSSSQQFEGYAAKTAIIGERQFRLFIADSEEKRAKGLSGSPPLAQNEGMIFVFPRKDYHRFWMKDMTYALDFIFVDGSQVVDILPNISPQTYPQTFTAKAPFDKVVELSFGVVRKTSLMVGDVLRL